MSTQAGREIEIKLRLSGAAEGRRRLRQAGFRVTRRRLHELNTVFDTPAGELCAAGLLLRLRICGSRRVLTFKGPSEPGRYKRREEIELELSDAAACERILARLGFQASFHYEKYRTEYRVSAGPGHAMLDETPVGVFVELEGAPGWIDSSARRLGFSEADYITATYAELHRNSAAARAGRRDMLFAPLRPG